MADASSFVIDPIGPDSPLVDAIVRDELVDIGRPRNLSERTSAQTLQSSRGHVARILNCSFWAGLAQEEGRPVSSGITFASPSDMDDQVRLARPCPLSVDNLVRLGTVAGTPQTLAVHEHEGEAQIWGFVRGHTPAPFWVTVWFDRPASLRVTVARAGVIALLERGNVFVPHGQYIANPGNLKVQLHRLVQAAPPEYPIEALSFIAQEMSRHGHGGTLLIVEPTSATWQSHVQVTYELADESQAVLKVMERRVRRPDKAEFFPREFLQDEMIRIARQIAGLTRIDGAAVIGRDLRVIGFGARVTTPDRPDARPPLRSRTIYDTEFAPAEWAALGGTRHQSAARFVAATRESIAFVSSHDGGLSAIAWNADGSGGHLQWLRGLDGLVGPT